MEISKMSNSHLEEIKDILLTDFDDFWTYSVFKSELQNPNSQYFVAIQDDEIVGFAGFKSIFDEADIMNIVVKKSYRNNGIRFLSIRKLDFICKKT